LRFGGDQHQRVGDGSPGACYIGFAKGDKALLLKRAFRSAPMSWTTPVVVEVCAGLEVTAYLTAEM